MSSSFIANATAWWLSFFFCCCCCCTAARWALTFLSFSICAVYTFVRLSSPRFCSTHHHMNLKKMLACFVGVTALLFSEFTWKHTRIEIPCKVDAGNVIGSIPSCDGDEIMFLRCDVYERASLTKRCVERRNVVCVCPQCNSTAMPGASASFANVGEPFNYVAKNIHRLQLEW
jgi:hypothetical protein